MPRDPIGTAGIVDAARGVSEAHMPEHATVERWHDGTFDPSDPGAAGGRWEQVTATVGRVDLAGQRATDRTVAGLRDLTEPIVVTMPAGTDVAKGDRITCGGYRVVVRVVQRPSYLADVRAIGEPPEGG